MLIESQAPITETDTSHYAASSAREKLVEHVFLGELLRGLWRKNVRDLNPISKSFTQNPPTWRPSLIASRG